MGIDIRKLENVSEKFDNKVIARCPACAAEGGDKKGEHLVIFPDGKFGCVKYEGDAAHRNRIHALAGDGKRFEHILVKVPVVPFEVPAPSVVIRLSEFPRFSGTVRRAWYAEEEPAVPLGIEAGTAQIESSFAGDSPGDQPARVKKQEDELEAPAKKAIRSSFFNVPPQRAGHYHVTQAPKNPKPPLLTPLPPNPLTGLV